MNILYVFFFVFCIVSSLESFERQIAVVVNQYFRGEYAFAQRIKEACRNIDWSVEIVDIYNCDLEHASYDFVINLFPDTYKKPKCKNYLAIFHPEYHYFEAQGHLTDLYRSYDGYLITYSADVFKDSFPCMKWYPTVHKREFQKVDPKYLFYICAVWGNRRSDPKFQEFFTLLAQRSFVKFYGYSKFKKAYPRCYQGEIPYDSNSLYKLAAEAGVSLVLHSDGHNRCKVPSGRIFEAAASSTVIICDQNDFVRENFGDSVLYIDTTKDAKSIYKQIMHHWNWIQRNPKEALKKAQKSYSIYRSKFLLEDQLLRLGEFHDRLCI